MTTFYIKTKTALVFFFLTAVLILALPYNGNPARDAFNALVSIANFFFLIVLIIKGILFLFKRKKEPLAP